MTVREINGRQAAVSENPEIGRTLDAGGITTNYHDHGEGRPVLMIHGSGPGVSSWANWRFTIPALAENFRVIAPDVVGFGFTQRPDGFQYNRQNWTQHLLDVIDALGLESLDVVGNSFGGAMALSLAAARPQQINRVVLMGAVGVHQDISPGLDAVWGCEPTFENLKEVTLLFAHDKSRITDDLVKLRFEAFKQPEVADAWAQMFPAPRQRWLDAMALSDDELRAVQQETLIVHGREDQVIPLAGSRKLSELLPHNDLHEFGRCGHWVQIEAGARFCRLVTDFLQHGLG